ncbi:MAG: YceI family protein, partial [Verrucomicrobia bacterium]|nr:YceI family protein [Verrucomicrobiota bacterium]
MNKVLIGLISLSLAAAVQAETFTVDAGHAEVGFSIKHMMVSNTKGTFNTFQGTLDYDIATQTLKSAEGTIETA